MPLPRFLARFIPGMRTCTPPPLKYADLWLPALLADKDVLLATVTTLFTTVLVLVALLVSEVWEKRASSASVLEIETSRTPSPAQDGPPSSPPLFHEPTGFTRETVCNDTPSFTDAREIFTRLSNEEPCVSPTSMAGNISTSDEDESISTDPDGTVSPFPSHTTFVAIEAPVDPVPPPSPTIGASPPGQRPTQEPPQTSPQQALPPQAALHLVPLQALALGPLPLTVPHQPAFPLAPPPAAALVPAPSANGRRLGAADRTMSMRRGPAKRGGAKRDSAEAPLKAAPPPPHAASSLDAPLGASVASNVEPAAMQPTTMQPLTMHPETMHPETMQPNTSARQSAVRPAATQHSMKPTTMPTMQPMEFKSMPAAPSPASDVPLSLANLESNLRRARESRESRAATELAAAVAIRSPTLTPSSSPSIAKEAQRELPKESTWLDDPAPLVQRMLKRRDSHEGDDVSTAHPLPDVTHLNLAVPWEDVVDAHDGGRTAPPPSPGAPPTPPTRAAREASGELSQPSQPPLLVGLSTSDGGVERRADEADAHAHATRPASEAEGVVVHVAALERISSLGPPRASDGRGDAWKTPRGKAAPRRGATPSSNSSAAVTNSSINSTSESVTASSVSELARLHGRVSGRAERAEADNPALARTLLLTPYKVCVRACKRRV